jgi:hypothetical protein
MSILTKNQLSASNQANFPDNTTGAITPYNIRSFNQEVIDTLVDSLNTGSYAVTTGSNDFTQANSFTSISASSFVSASAFVGDGSKITGITASIAMPISDEGILQGYATQLNFSGSNISASVQAAIATISVNTNNLVTTSSFNSFTASVNTFTASQETKDSTLATYTASVNTKFTTIGQSTASLNTFTSSQETKNSTLAVYTASVDTKFSTIGTLSASWDNTVLNLYTASQNTKNSTLAAYTASVDTKFSNIGSQSGSWITESETGSFAILGASNTFTQANNFTSISASSFVSGTFFVGDGSKLTNIPGAVPLTSLNAFTASQETKNSTLASYTASVDTKFSTLATQSGSWITSTQTSSMSVATASVALAVSTSISTQNLQHFVTFVDNSTGTQAIYVDGGLKYNPNQDLLLVSNISSSGYISGSSLNLTGTLTASLQQGYAWVGNGSNISTLVATSSFGGALPTGTISGSAQITALGFVSSSVTASSLVTASFSGNTLTFTKGNGTTFGVVIPDVSGSTINTGSFITTGSASTGSQTVKGDFKFDTTYTATALAVSQAGGSNIIYIDYNVFNGIYGYDFGYWSNNNFSGVTVNGTGVTNAIVTTTGYGTYYEVTLNTGTVSSGSTYTFTGPNNQTIDITGSLSVNTQINVSTGNGNTITMDGNGFSVTSTTFGGTLNAGIVQLRPANSNDIFQFAASSSAMYNGGGQWSGPQIAGYTNDLGDASIIGFQSDSSWTDGRVTILRPLIAQSGSVISGSLTVTGSAYGNVVSMSITSNTASMDLSKGNYFTLTLATSASTHISASNVQPGVSATLVITTGTNSSASLAPTMLQPSGSAYSATNGSGKKDVLSIVAVASGVPFVVSTKNMV